MSESPSLSVLAESIAEAYTLLPPEIDFIGSKKASNRFGQALMLKYFQEHGHFPEQLEAISSEAIGWIAEQLRVSPELIRQFDWQGRSCMRYWTAIRKWLGYRPNTLNEQARSAGLISGSIANLHQAYA